MAASKFVLALLLVTVAQCGNVLDKGLYDAKKAQIEDEEAAFVKAHKELKPAFEYLEDVFAAGAKYECAIEGDEAAECIAFKDMVKLWAKIINAVTPSADETSKALEESDSMLQDAKEGVGLTHAVLAAIKKKQGDEAKPLLDLFKNMEKETGISQYF